MNNYVIKLVLEGPHEEDGDVRLDVFVAQLQRLQDALKKTDEGISNGKNTTSFKVIDLSHNSPAAVSIEACPINKDRDNRFNIIERFGATLRSVGNNTIGAANDANYAVLESLMGLAKPVNEHKLGTTKIFIKNEIIEINPQTYNEIKKALDNVETCYTSFEGRLEQVNIHINNTFFIYPLSGGQKIRCIFQQTLLEDVRAAIGRKVSVSGNAKYRKNSYFPYEIQITKLEIYPLDNELPNFREMKGIAPNATNGLSSEDFIAKIRGEWQ